MNTFWLFSSVVGNLDNFYLLAIINNAAGRMLIIAALQLNVSFSIAFEYMSGWNC